MKTGKNILMGIALTSALFVSAQEPVDYVNPFVGTTNYGTTNPGAVVPQGMMSATPFNVMGSEDNKYDKDKQWWSTPYEVNNKYLTGFSHVNLSGVGCPDLGSLLLMPTSGELNVKYTQYGSEYTDEVAVPGYYSNMLTKYGIKCEMTATPRTSRARFTFHRGQGNLLMNLGEGLTNETGATVRFVNDREIEGSKLLGTFCYNPQAVFPIYFVMRIDKAPATRGYWKLQRPMQGVEAEWDGYSGKYKLYTSYSKEMSGDDVGAWFTFDTTEGEAIEVSIGVSFVSIENARLNLETEQPAGTTFDQIRAQARKKWNEDLSRILVEGGTEEQKGVFYTALYHTMIHPNILQDVNGQYPQMEGDKILTTDRNRYTVYSLWDTYRNFHQLMTLVYPERQMDMVRTMLDMYREHDGSQMELYGRETLTMEGDPSIPVIVDTWMKGLRDFDINLAYEGMYKSATTPGKDNLMRPDIDDYIAKGYCPLMEQYDNSVSHALEYYIADYSLYTLAKALGKTEDAKLFYDRSMGYKHYYCKEFGTLRPILPDGTFYGPFDPLQGANFEPSPGFHEGNSWNYTFYVPHDVKGLAKLMGGQKRFVNKLQMVFDKGYYDPANEPDIAYPYLFSYFKGEEWRTQKLVKELLAKHYTTKPNGLPGNEDTGTMSSWAIFSMMGFYPDCPGVPEYTLTTPTFDKITIKLDPAYWGTDKLVIRKEGGDGYIDQIRLGGKKYSKYRLTHEDLIHAGEITFVCK